MRVVFFGTPDFALPALEAVRAGGHGITGVVTQPDRPKGRRRLLSPPPVKVLAERMGLPLLQPETIRSQDFLDWLRERDPEILVVVAYGKILPSPVLNLPRFGSINLHASLLPRYRGAAPIHWAVINGEKTTGVTTMYMADQLDAGDIIQQETTSIGPDETTGELHDRLAGMGAKLLVRTLSLIEAGQAERLPQDHSLATYAPSLKPDDEIIDWEAPAPSVFNRIRGLSPWPGASTFWKGKRLKIMETALKGKADGPVKPGRILACTREGIEVGCGDGQAVVIRSLQPAGKAAMSADAFLRGYRMQPGETLDRN